MKMKHLLTYFEDEINSIFIRDQDTQTYAIYLLYIYTEIHTFTNIYIYICMYIYIYMYVYIYKFYKFIYSYQ